MAKKVKSVKGATRVMKCTCSHAFQDKRYGKGKRVHNLKSGRDAGYVCTVCSRVKVG